MHPDYRLYLTDWPRIFIESNVYGMYFFGYGNYVVTMNDIGITVSKDISLNAGYSPRSRLVITETSDRLGMHLTQQGPIAGLEYSF